MPVEMHKEPESHDNLVWIEVSGPIEHYAKVHNGQPLPNHLAAKYWKSKNAVVDCLLDDGIHYKRKIGDGDALEKAIYGFKDLANVKEVTNEVNNVIMKNSLSFSGDQVDSLVKDFATAVDFIDLLDTCYDENKVRELTVEFARDLEQAISILQKPNYVSYGNNYLELAQYLKSVMPTLTTFTLDI